MRAIRGLIFYGALALLALANDLKARRNCVCGHAAHVGRCSYCHCSGVDT